MTARLLNTLGPIRIWQCLVSSCLLAFLLASRLAFIITDLTFFQQFIGYLGNILFGFATCQEFTRQQ